MLRGKGRKQRMVPLARDVSAAIDNLLRERGVGMSYALERDKALRVCLENPQVPIDTNHLEREIRPIAVGRKNWLFCWTEVGAKYVGIIQSLLATCRLQGVDPYTYLVDVLQRIETHPAREAQLLTPRLWKLHFAQNPLRSHIDARRL